MISQLWLFTGNSHFSLSSVLFEIRAADPCRGGRPHVSWLRQVESYLKDTGMAGLASVWVMVRRRPKEYRRKVDAATRCSGVCPHTWPVRPDKLMWTTSTVEVFSYSRIFETDVHFSLRSLICTNAGSGYVGAGPNRPFLLRRMIGATPQYISGKLLVLVHTEALTFKIANSVR